MKKFSVEFILSARITCQVEAEDAEEAKYLIGGNIPSIEYSETDDTDVVAWKMLEIDVKGEDGKLDPISYSHFSKWPPRKDAP